MAKKKEEWRHGLGDGGGGVFVCRISGSGQAAGAISASRRSAA